MVTIHTHISALSAVTFFLMLVLIGTLWRLVAAHLVRRGGAAAAIGGAMAAQF